MSYLPSISSHSLGRAWVHDLPPKFQAATTHGFQGVEVFYEDLCTLAKQLPNNPNPSNPVLTSENQLQAARIIKTLLDSYHLTATCLQPFMHYEGLLDREEHARRVEEMKLWFKLAKILDTDLILIPSNFRTEGVTDDMSVIVEDLREVADLGLQQTPAIRFVYEALCWGTYINKWEQSWEIVKAVDRPNFGLCIDTFNLAGKIYADPASSSGKTPTADKDFADSMALLKRELAGTNLQKLFFVQLVDAERLEKPLVKGHEWYVEEQPSRMSWSRNARAFPYEEKAYLPVEQIMRTVCELGYTGWVSYELFARSLEDKSASCPDEHARRGMQSWAIMEDRLGWNQVPSEKMPVILVSEAFEIERARI